jgi:hypothetical protein
MNLAQTLADKLDKAAIREYPFRHILIENFLPQSILERLLEAATVPYADSFKKLKATHKIDWKVQPFPGCARGWIEYQVKRKLGMPWNDPRLSGQGLALRYNGASPIIEKVTSAMTSDIFIDAVCRKLSIQDSVSASSGLQKYLNGYEIAPHTDPAGKKATMLINLGVNGFRCNGTGTKLMRTKPEKRHIETFWSNNRHIEPDWILWEWCEEHAIVDGVNDFLLFHPTGETIHAVKCEYDHLRGQRMQVYSDLWLNSDNPRVPPKASYKDLNIEPRPSVRRRVTMMRQNRRLKKAVAQRGANSSSA